MLSVSPLKVNCYNHFNAQVAFGGYKHSGIGRKMGENALSKYVFFFPLLITRVAILFYFLSATQKSKLCTVTMSSISTTATPDATMNTAAKLKPKTVPICQHPHHEHAHKAWHDTSASNADEVHHNFLPM